MYNTCVGKLNTLCVLLATCMTRICYTVGTPFDYKYFKCWKRTKDKDVINIKTYKNLYNNLNSRINRVCIVCMCFCSRVYLSLMIWVIEVIHWAMIQAVRVTNQWKKAGCESERLLSQSKRLFEILKHSERFIPPSLFPLQIWDWWNKVTVL